jgi:hypothetical protein
LHHTHNYLYFHWHCPHSTVIAFRGWIIPLDVLIQMYLQFFSYLSVLMGKNIYRTRTENRDSVFLWLIPFNLYAHV